jgi:hypothetical protein
VCGDGPCFQSNSSRSRAPTPPSIRPGKMDHHHNHHHYRRRRLRSRRRRCHHSILARRALCARGQSACLPARRLVRFINYSEYVPFVLLHELELLIPDCCVSAAAAVGVVAVAVWVAAVVVAVAVVEGEAMVVTSTAIDAGTVQDG